MFNLTAMHFQLINCSTEHQFINQLSRVSNFITGPSSDHPISFLALTLTWQDVLGSRPSMRHSPKTLPTFTSNGFTHHDSSFWRRETSYWLMGFPPVLGSCHLTKYLEQSFASTSVTLIGKGFPDVLQRFRYLFSKYSKYLIFILIVKKKI